MAKETEHKEGKATVKVVYYIHKTLKDGSHPFVVRITKNRKNRWISTGISLHPQYWNEKKGEIRRNYPVDKKDAIEASLRKWEEKYSNAAETLALSDESHNADSVATKVSEERKITRQFKLLAYFEELIRQFENTGNVGNKKVYRDIQNNLCRFIGAEVKLHTNDQGVISRTWANDVPFERVTVKFCNEWERKMRAEGLAEITLSVKFRTLRAALNKAIADGYAKPDQYPFARNTAEKHKFQISKFDTKTTKRAISKSDIQSIEAYEVQEDKEPYASLRNTVQRIQLAKDLFLFSYYCGGINFVDMAMLQWSNIGIDIDGKPRLTYTRQKTGGKFSIRLLPKVMIILERYKPEKARPTEYVFPILNNALHKTPTQQHNRCNKILGQVNTDLKTIGKEAGISTPLTSYVARHSFATALKRSGVTTAVISEAMGHQDERTTQIYLSEFETDLVDAAFDNL